MATYTDAVLVYDNGNLRKVAVGDSITLTGGGTFTASNFAGNGSLLTSLDAGNLATGTVNDARLSANVPLLNAAVNAFTGDVSVGGNLIVTGDIISRGAYNVMVGDSFLDLNAGNTVTGSAKAGGFTVNVQAVGTPATGTAFVAGVAATSNPYVTVSADPTSDFAAGEIIQISGTAEGKNDGLFVVSATSASPNRITVKGVGTVAPATDVPFVQTQFVAQTGQSATITRVNLAALCFSDGVITKAGGATISAGTLSWNYQANAAESAFHDTWYPVPTSTGGVVTLQDAYDSSTSPATILLANGKNFVIQKPSSGTAALSLGANLASDITIDGATFTLSASRIDLNTGNVKIAKAGVIERTTTGTAAGDVVYFDASGVAQKTDCDSGTTAARRVDGIVAESGYVCTIPGTRVVVTCTGTAPSVGDIVWASATAGAATGTVPTSGKITELGRVLDTTGGNITIVFAPRYIADI